MSPQPSSRTPRAVVFATVCTTLAVLGHSLTTPMAVPTGSVAVGFCGVLAVSHLLAGHERSLPTIMGGLLFGQFALHSLFAGAAAPSAHHATGGLVVHESGTAMTLAHVTAAVVSGWWLRRGERAVWALARKVAQRPIRLLLLVVEPVAPSLRTAVMAQTAPTPPARRALRHQVVRRGPPPRSRALASG